MVEGRIDHARRHTIRNQRSQRRIARAARKLDPVAILDAALFGVMGMDFQTILLVPDDVFRAPCLCADIVLRQDAAGGEQQRETRTGALIRRHIFRADELALAAHEAVHMHDRRTLWEFFVAGPLHRALLFEVSIGNAGKTWRRCRYFVHDLGGMGVVPRKTHGLRQLLGYLPVGITVLRRHDLAHAVNAALGIGKGAVLFEEGGTRQEHMRVICRLVQEEIVHHDTFHGGKAGGNVLGIGVRLENVLALNIDALETAINGSVEHVGNAKPRFVVKLHAPEFLEHIPCRIIGDMAIARQFVRERPHIAGSLHIVLTAQRIDAYTGTADVAGRHGKIGNRHDGR